jgi:hypothetical protein
MDKLLKLFNHHDEIIALPHLEGLLSKALRD